MTTVPRPGVPGKTLSLCSSPEDAFAAFDPDYNAYREQLDDLLDSYADGTLSRAEVQRYLDEQTAYLELKLRAAGLSFAGYRRFRVARAERREMESRTQERLDAVNGFGKPISRRSYSRVEPRPEPTHARA